MISPNETKVFLATAFYIAFFLSSRCNELTKLLYSISPSLTFVYTFFPLYRSICFSIVVYVIKDTKFHYVVIFFAFVQARTLQLAQRIFLLKYSLAKKTLLVVRSPFYLQCECVFCARKDWMEQITWNLSSDVYVRTPAVKMCRSRFLIQLTCIENTKQEEKIALLKHFPKNGSEWNISSNAG